MNWLMKWLGGAAQRIEWHSDAVILDVRSPAEFASGHVQGAINVPLDVFNQKHAKAAPNKACQVIVYCRSGARSAQAMRLLQALHYENVVNGGSAAAVARKVKRDLV
jgi:phage shock protein E